MPTKKNVNEIITERLIAVMESGVNPWVATWSTIGGMPTNLVSMKRYNGINVILTATQRYGSPYWVSFKQARDLGGNVKKGEKSTPIIFYGRGESKTKTDKNGNPEKFTFFTPSRIFNVEQTEGFEYPKPVMQDHDPIPVCESVIADWTDGPEIVHGGGRACYDRSSDRINMPDFGRFVTPEAYYSTAFHEMIHATGHKSRLDRLTDGGFGSGSYSREELTAEIGAAFVCGHCGIETKTIENTAAYLAHWIKVLKGDNKLVVSAGSKAQAASNLILNIKASYGSDSETASAESDKEVASDRRVA